MYPTPSLMFCKYNEKVNHKEIIFSIHKDENAKVGFDSDCNL